MSAPRPLAGIRIVEFSHMVMGPSCGLVLGDLGADVIKIEPRGEGDKTRRIVGAGAGFFATFNRNKRSLAVDLKSERGLALVKRLVATADAVTENFRPGALEALGLGYEALRAVRPGLIYCSLKGFLSGPYENRAALDEVVQMMGGLAYMTGPPGRPLRAGASVNDIMGGMFAVIGILSAIHERRVTGEGRWIKTGLFENNSYLVASHMLQYAVTGEPAAPMPDRISAWAVYDIFETKEGSQVFVGIVTDRQWRIFCEEFGLTEFAADPTLRSNADRVAARPRILPRLRALFADLGSAELLEILERLGLPYAPIGKPHELYENDPHLNHPGAMVEITLADGRKVKSPALPLEFDGVRPALRLDLPRVGEHGREVAREIGFAESEIADLIESGVMQVEA